MDQAYISALHRKTLVSVEPATNRCRFFVVELRATPEGGAALLKRWGRVGTPGRRASERFKTAEAAEDAFAALLELRARHGYVESGVGPLSALVRQEADLDVKASASRFDVGLALALDAARRQLARMRVAMLPGPVTSQLKLPGLFAA